MFCDDAAAAVGLLCLNNRTRNIYNEMFERIGGIAKKKINNLILATFSIIPNVDFSDALELILYEQLDFYSN